VTHIVTDAPEKTTLRALGIRSLKEIPDHVPTVKWTWVPSGLGAVTTTDGAEGGTEMEVEMDGDAWQHAAFHERIDVGVRFGSSSRVKGKGKDKAAVPTATTTEEISHISYVLGFSVFSSF
jgi:DNA polymerase lambda